MLLELLIMRKSLQVNHYPDVRPWVKRAIAQEDAKPPDRMWKGEPGEAEVVEGQRKRVRFLRKRAKADPQGKIFGRKGCNLVTQGEDACPERAYIVGGCCSAGREGDQSDLLLSKHPQTTKGNLIAISIVPPNSATAPGQLKKKKKKKIFFFFFFFFF